MTDEAPKPAKKECRVCAELIEGRALKCIHCDSYQDWRRHLGFGTTVLSLLIALVAVATPLIGAIEKFFHVSRAELRFSVQSAQAGVLTVLVTNDGERPGAIAQGTLSFPRGEGAYLRPLSPGGASLTPGGGSTLAHYAVEGRPQAFPNANENCKLSFMITGTDPTRRTYDFDEQPVRCGYLSMLFPEWRFDPDTGKPVPPTK